MSKSNKVTLRFKRLHDRATMPRRGTDGSACYDMVATTKTIGQGGVITYGTGIAVEIPEGYVGLVFPRSSVVKTMMTLSNCVGVIDSDYRGEVMVKYYADGCAYPYSTGDRVCQLMVIPVPSIEWEEVDELSVTERGCGGYGSTGV